eukprot:TRINITY_DN2442_c0_g1_i2.p1 TRINITY_DN2442_c0_g1~~TRINITY_DN2442_c0_g1_i2.p1  ORF type:complete len:153 (+),score=38.57 TRINITY_DN2442_c0_g1_i2:339-797(+)
MFDLTRKNTYKNLNKWWGQISQQHGAIPTVVVGHKADHSERQLKPNAIAFHKKNNLLYYEVSSKANYMVERLILSLLRKSTGDGGLSFSVSPMLQPPEIEMPSDWMEKILDDYYDDTEFIGKDEEDEENKEQKEKDVLSEKEEVSEEFERED